MKNWLGALAISMGLFFAPIGAAKDETTKHGKSKKTAVTGKSTKEKKSEASSKHAKSSKSKKKDVEKKSAKAKKKKAKTDHSKKPKTSKEGKLKSAQTSKDTDEVVGRTFEGKPVFEGSRSGHYFLDEIGNKEYVKDFSGEKIIGQTPSGKNIYEGPRGGHFYYTDSGNKEYLPR